MYHCLLQFYLTGPSSALWDTARSMPALDGFQHAFTESREPQTELASQADVILADLRELDAAALRVLTAVRKPGSELVLLAEREQIPLLAAELDMLESLDVLLTLAG